jgi:nicotinamidase-related amidase
MSYDAPMADIAKLDPKTSALLTLDCQKGIVGFVAGSERIFQPAARVLEAARARRMRVIHVGIGFRPGYPEVQPEHPIFSAIRKTNKFVTGTETAEFHESLGRKPDEIEIIKHRVSAFSGNDLEMILRSQGITHLVLFGIATSGIVLSTVRQASDLDFRCVVVKDCCFDGDEEVHRVLTEKVFPRQAAVVGADDFIQKML